jgi:hypothetical protein
MARSRKAESVFVVKVRKRSRNGLKRQAEVVANIAPAHRQGDHSGFRQALIHFKQKCGDAFDGALAAEQQHMRRCHVWNFCLSSAPRD